MAASNRGVRRGLDQDDGRCGRSLGTHGGDAREQ